jgi:hypothetical protein
MPRCRSVAMSSVAAGRPSGDEAGRAWDQPWRRLRLHRRGVAGHHRQPLEPGVEPMPAQHLEHAAGGDDQATSHRHPQLRGDAPWPQPRLSQRKGDRALLQTGRHPVGHARRSSLSRSQHLEAVALHHRPPAVIRGAMKTEFAAGLAHPHHRSPSEEVHPHAEEHVIIGHRAGLLESLNSPRMDRFLMPGSAPHLSRYLPSCSRSFLLHRLQSADVLVANDTKSGRKDSNLRPLVPRLVLIRERPSPFD